MKIYENDILIRCDQCTLELKEKIENSVPIDVPEKYKQCLLDYIVSKLMINEEYFDRPCATRKKITERLLLHGQFSREEIDEVFEKHAHMSTSYSDEFIDNHPEIDFRKLVFEKQSIPGKYSESIFEKKYNLTNYCCEMIDYMDLCPEDIVSSICPDCGKEVKHYPDNFSGGLYRGLTCRSCEKERKNIFDKKGLVKPGYPPHHGEWGRYMPEFQFSGTDYFAILHPECEKSPSEDRMGVMLVNGIWIDDSSRIVLGLECFFCGARNALKPALRTGDIPVLNYSGAEWRNVSTTIEDIIALGEGHSVEFKRSFLKNNDEIKISEKRIKDIVESVVSFLNADGGHLLIGVDNNKQIVGIDEDLALLKEPTTDEFELYFKQQLINKTEKIVYRYIHVSFETVEGEIICHVIIDPSADPVFVNGGTTFIVRSGNGRITFNKMKDAVEYLQLHWKNRTLVYDG